MLRFNDQLRLSTKEAGYFHALTGRSVVTPTTVTEYNRTLSIQARLFGEGTSPEEKLLARLLRNEMLPAGK